MFEVEASRGYSRGFLSIVESLLGRATGSGATPQEVSMSGGAQIQIVGARSPPKQIFN
jgi:hypothetical protein